jgi:hypothetical protein
MIPGARALTHRAGVTDGASAAASHREASEFAESRRIGAPGAHQSAGGAGGLERTAPARDGTAASAPRPRKPDEISVTAPNARYWQTPPVHTWPLGPHEVWFGRFV